VVKPQYVDHIPRAVRGNVGEVLRAKDGRGDLSRLLDELDLEQVTDRDVAVLSGGELQRFAMAVIACQKADVYMVDEPSSYLDVRQRLRAAVVCRDLLGSTGPNGRAPSDPERPSYVIVVEHDLAVLDYLSDYVCCLYGTPGAYGVITMPFSVREGINIFLAGFVPTENLRFRDAELTFKVAETAGEEDLGAARSQYTYPALTVKQGGFQLDVEAGSFSSSEIVVLLGENGTGKTTFVRVLAGLLPPTSPSTAKDELPTLSVSYKPQKIAPKFPGSVRDLLTKKIREAYAHPQFQSDVMKPMKIDPLLDQMVTNLSGGELQRVALVLALGTPADVYLIDEPSAYLDAEQRIVAAKCIKRYIMARQKTAFIVEHDFIMATYLADRVVVYEGQPSKHATARAPQPLLSGMNTFLKNLEITFRRDPSNHRPRINKANSVKDAEQKKAGSYFNYEETGPGATRDGKSKGGKGVDSDDDD